MVKNLTKQTYLIDIKVHNQAVKLKSKEYVLLLTLLVLIYAVGIAIPFSLLIFPGDVCHA